LDLRDKKREHLKLPEWHFDKKTGDLTRCDIFLDMPAAMLFIVTSFK